MVWFLLLDQQPHIAIALSAYTQFVICYFTQNRCFMVGGAVIWARIFVYVCMCRHCACWS